MNPRIYMETPRLRLRVAHPEDVRPIHLAVRHSLPELSAHMQSAFKGRTQKQTRDYVYTVMALFVQDVDYVFAMFMKETGNFVGFLSLTPVEPKIPSFELGFWVRSDVTRRGLASEAAQEAARYAFETLKAKRVFMRMDGHNLASQRVAEKCGFIKEGHLKNEALSVDGTHPIDTLIYAHTDESWAAQS